MKISGVEIVPRKMNFDLAECNTHDWCCNDVIRTAYMNGMSLALPIGEDFFIRSVRQFEDKVSEPLLRDELKRFIAQESIHSRQHHNYNNMLVRDGYEIAAIEQRTRDALHEAWEKSSRMERLSYTIALEHITHVLGDQILSHGDRLSGWDKEFRAFWLWHAAEEIEHKAVCYDLYSALGGGFLMRNRALVKMTARMMDIFWKNQHDLLEQTCTLHGLEMPSRARISQVNMEFMFGIGSGILRGSTRSYFAWFLPGYHPWKHDNRSVLNAWKRDVLPLNHVADAIKSV